MEVIFGRVLGKQLLGFLFACCIPICELCLIYPECFVCLSLRVKNFCTHIPCAEPQSVIGAAVKNFFADRNKFIFVFKQDGRVVVCHIACGVPHIVMHDPIVIRIIMICLDNKFASLAIIPMLSVKCDRFIYISLNFFMIVSHKLIKCYLKEVCQWLQKRNVGIRFAAFPLAYRSARDVHRSRELLLCNIFGRTQTFYVCTDSHFHNSASVKTKIVSRRLLPILLYHKTGV